MSLIAAIVILAQITTGYASQYAPGRMEEVIRSRQNGC